MISFHPNPGSSAATVQRGWRTVDTVDVKRIAKGISQYPWSPCVWKDGDKRIANFLHADFIALDFDTPELPLAQAVNVFCDYVHIIGTTKSHQKDKGGITCDRYRVVIKLDSRIEDEPTFRGTLRREMGKYPADEACKDGGRFFWPCKEIVSVSDEGYTMEVGEPLVATTNSAMVYETGAMPRRIIRALNEVIPPLTRNTTCYAIAVNLGLAGLSEDAIVSKILLSPTYRSTAQSPQLVEEIKRAVRSGLRTALAEIGQLAGAAHDQEDRENI